MIIYGWGKSSKQWQKMVNGEAKILICSYNYFSLFFFLTIAFNAKWFLAGENRSEDKQLTYTEVKKLFPEKTPRLGIWKRFSLLIVITSLILFGTISAFMAPKTTKPSVSKDEQAAQFLQIVKSSSDEDFEKVKAKFSAKEKQSLDNLRAMYKAFPELDEQYTKNGEQVKKESERQVLSKDQYYALAENIKTKGTYKPASKTYAMKAKSGKLLAVRVEKMNEKEIIQEFAVKDSVE
jgi:hypothetical protein